MTGRISKSDIKIGHYVSKYSRPQEHGLSVNSLPFEYAGVPCYTIRGASLARRITFITLLRTLDPNLLRELNIRWLVIEFRTLKLVDLRLIEELKKKNFIREVLVTDYEILGNEKMILYEFINLDEYIKAYSRKVYWTFTKYFDNNLISIPDKSGKNTIFLFNTEKEATNFLKARTKENPSFKKARPFVDAISEELLKEQAGISNLNIKYAN